MTLSRVHTLGRGLDFSPIKTYPSMVQVILIRPGDSDYVEQGTFRARSTCLSRGTGHDEVSHLAVKQLSGRGIEAIYTGTCHPTLETATAIAEASKVTSS